MGGRTPGRVARSPRAPAIAGVRLFGRHHRRHAVDDDAAICNSLEVSFDLAVREGAPPPSDVAALAEYNKLMDRWQGKHRAWSASIPNLECCAPGEATLPAVEASDL